MQKKTLSMLTILFLFSGSLAYAKIESPTPLVSRDSPKDKLIAQNKLEALNDKIENLKKEIVTQKQKQSQAVKQLDSTQKKLIKITQTLQLLTRNIENKKMRSCS